jgi:hypothetical protein
LTVKLLVPLVPPLVVTVTLAAPVAALPPMVNVAVRVVEFDTVTPLTATPLLATDTVLAPGTKFVPVRVTDTALP